MRSVVNTSLDALNDLVDGYGEDLPLDRALLAIAMEEYPKINARHYLGALDDLADRALERAERTGRHQSALAQTLFAEAKFRGNGENYYDPKNSLLNVVIDRRVGIPITLSIVYIEVARRTGSRAMGIGFPGHFLVQHEVDGHKLLIDPFDCGSVLDVTDCERILNGLSTAPKELEPWMLAPSSPRAIVARVLTNLKHAYLLEKDFIGAVKAIDRLLVVDPDRETERRDRGLLYAELGMAKSAIVDLEQYLETALPGPEEEAISALIPTLRAASRRLN
ncbi:MAG: tetratricopeptide repeat protein [Deltaproteobacteria bacterium]|jgi:regulator of sirC expression with transglutaminase-like and TPR domain